MPTTVPGAKLWPARPTEAWSYSSLPPKLKVRMQCMGIVPTATSFISPAGPNPVQLCSLRLQSKPRAKTPRVPIRDSLPSRAQLHRRKMDRPQARPGESAGHQHHRVRPRRSARQHARRTGPHSASTQGHNLYRCPCAGRKIELENANGMAEPRQRISSGTRSAGCSPAAGFAAHLQRCGRDGSHPQSCQRLDRCAFCSHAYA